MKRVPLCSIGLLTDTLLPAQGIAVRVRLSFDDGREIRCEFTEIEFDTNPKKR